MEHWTDSHIVFNSEREVWVGYNEAGLEECSSPDREQVVQELEEYADTL